MHQVGGIGKHLCQGSGRFLHTEGQAADVELLEESLARCHCHVWKCDLLTWENLHRGVNLDRGNPIFPL